MKNTIPTNAHIKGIRYHNQPAKVWLNNKRLKLDESLKYANHSPTGFEWGYAGSGPTQLAFEICRQLYGLDLAQRVTTGFRAYFLEAIKEDSFDLKLDLKKFNTFYVQPLNEREQYIVEEPDDTELYETDNGPTGHGETCYSDADPGL
jgi:hypothetical protein